MGWTKQQLLTEAFGELGVHAFEFDITPEEQQTALRRLDTMLATWEAHGIRLGYAFPASVDASDPDVDSGLPDNAVETVYLNLAVRLAPGFGKQLSAATITSAQAGREALLARAAMPIEQQFRASMPRGAGNKPWRSPNRPYLVPPDDDPLQINQGGDLVVLPE